MKWRAAFRPKSYRDMRVGCQLGWLQLESKKEPGSRWPPGTVWEETPNVGLRTATRQAMVAQCSPSPTKAEGPAARRRISMRRKPADPDADGIADDGGNENGENQRPAAMVAKKVHRIRSNA